METAAAVIQPGRYRYSDPIGGPPVLVEVRHDGDALVACFPDCDGEGPCDVEVAAMAGTFDGPLTRAGPA